MMQLRPVWKALESNEINPNKIVTEKSINKINYLKEAMKSIKPIVKQMSEKYKTWQEKVPI